MKFKLECQKALDALSLLGSFTKSEFVVLDGTTDKDAIRFYASGVECTSWFVVPAEIEKKGKFTVALSILKQILLNRKIISFTVLENKVKFKSKQYSGEVLLVPTTQDPSYLLDGIVWHDTNSEIMRIIREVVPSIALSDVYGADDIPVLFNFTPGNVSMGCYSKYHLAYYEGTMAHNAPKGQFAIPLSIFSEIQMFIGRGEVSKDVELGFAENQFAIKTLHDHGEDILLLPYVVPTDYSWSVLDNLVKSFPQKVNGSLFAKFQKKPLRYALDNAAGIYEPGAAITINVEKGTPVLSTQTDYGKLNCRIKGSRGTYKAASCKLDLAILTDLVTRSSNANPQLSLCMANDGVAFFRETDSKNHGQFTYSCTIL